MVKSNHSTATKTISVVIAGINGRMGRATVAALTGEASIGIAGAFGRRAAEYSGKTLDEIGISSKNDVRIADDFTSCLSELTNKPDVLIDFTEAKSAIDHSLLAMGKGIKSVIGTSGLTEDNLKVLKQASEKTRTGLLVVPNFSVGAVLLISFAKQASKFFSSAEIVETHKLGKLDAPSGTAMYTARVMGTEAEKIKQTFNLTNTKETEILPGARGAKLESGIHVHSVRLPGILSKQDVYFAGEGELLTLRHESHNTKCFEQGIVLAIKSAYELHSFVLGLENIIEQFANKL